MVERAEKEAFEKIQLCEEEMPLGGTEGDQLQRMEETR